MGLTRKFVLRIYLFPPFSRKVSLNNNVLIPVFSLIRQESSLAQKVISVYVSSKVSGFSMKRPLPKQVFGSNTLTVPISKCSERYVLVSNTAIFVIKPLPLSQVSSVNPSKSVVSSLVRSQTIAEKFGLVPISSLAKNNNAQRILISFGKKTNKERKFIR